MAVLQSFKRSSYSLVFERQSFDGFIRQAKEIATIEKKDKLSWSKDFEPVVNKNFKAISRIFSSHFLGHNTDDETASLIAISWVTSLGAKVLKERIELNEAGIRLFESVKIAFETLAKTYKDEFENKYGKCVAKNMETMEFYTPMQNYEVATRDLNNLVRRPTEQDDRLSKSGEDCQRKRLEDLKRMFPNDEEESGEGIGEVERRQRRIEEDSMRIGLDPTLQQVPDATLEFFKGEGFLSLDFSGVHYK